MNKKQRKTVEVIITVAFFWVPLSIEFAISAIKVFDIYLPMQTQIYRIIAMMWCIKICFSKYRIREYVIIALFLGIGVLAYFASGRGIDTLFRVTAFIAASKGIERKNVYKILLCTTVFTFSVNFIQSLLGMKMLYSVGEFGRGSTELRYTFGYSQANMFHYHLWLIIALIIAIWGEKIKVWQYGVLLAVNMVVVLLTKSRTGFIVLSLVLLMAVCMKLKGGNYLNRRRMMICTAIVLGVVLILTVVAMTVKDEENILLYWVSRVFTGRFRWAYMYSHTYPLTWFSYPNFPVTFEFVVERSVDMGFVRLLYCYGMVPAVMYIVSIIYIIWYDYRTNDRWNQLFLIGTLAYLFMEAVQMNSDFVFNTVILMLVGIHSRKNVGKEYDSCRSLEQSKE